MAPVAPGSVTVDKIRSPPNSLRCCESVERSPVRSGTKTQSATNWRIPEKIHYFGVALITFTKIM